MERKSRIREHRIAFIKQHADTLLCSKSHNTVVVIKGTIVLGYKLTNELVACRFFVAAVAVQRHIETRMPFTYQRGLSCCRITN